MAFFRSLQLGLPAAVIPTTLNQSKTAISNIIRTATIATKPWNSQSRSYAVSTPQDQARKVAIIGSGTIGLSFAALHLTLNPLCVVKIHDPRPDLSSYIEKHLPKYFPPKAASSSAELKAFFSRIETTKTLSEAVREANIIQESGPEHPSFKRNLWAEVEGHAKQDALLWSSTSGIAASVQSEGMLDRGRVLVVHPFNPPHLMPLLEVVPSAQTKPEILQRTLDYWKALGRTPVVVKKECTGFVANRLAFALFREACSLVQQGIVDVKGVDDVVTASLGPRFAVTGPFKAYHAGGGEGGMLAFMEKIGGTIQECWEKSEEDVKKGDIRVGQTWQEEMCRQSEAMYGAVDTAERDRITRKILDAAKKEDE